jgi:predicted lipid carrier protein YhbT
MTTFLSQEWLDADRASSGSGPAVPGASARVQWIVTGAPDGEVRFTSVFEDGRVVEQALGDDPGADFTLTAPLALFEAIRAGEVDETVAFMQGKLKFAGDMGRYLRLMPLKAQR